MRPPEVLKYLFDVSQSCDLLTQFTAGKTLATYMNDPMLRSAVERQFEIIGEALNLALRLDPSLSDFISDTSRIIAFRNRLIHGYAAIAADIVWGIVEANLPTLRRQVQALLAQAENEER
jgi:uncharacterized protein with HEPN domain